MHAGGGVAPDRTKQKNDEQRCTILSLPSMPPLQFQLLELSWSWGGGCFVLRYSQRHEDINDADGEPRPQVNRKLNLKC